MKKKLTDWEAGQELIVIADTIGFRKSDLKDSHPDLYKMLDEIQRTVGDKFNALNSHDFGLYCSETKLHK